MVEIEITCCDTTHQDKWTFCSECVDCLRTRIAEADFTIAKWVKQCAAVEVERDRAKEDFKNALKIHIEEEKQLTEVENRERQGVPGVYETNRKCEACGQTTEVGRDHRCA